MIVRFIREATDEVKQIIGWYETQSNDLADRFQEELRIATEKMEQFPRAYPVMERSADMVFHCAQLRRFPYSVIFHHSEDTIHVVAVAHLRRKPGYWRSRTDFET